MSERVDKLMNRLSDWFCQEISGNVSKAAADIVRAQKDGVGAYSIGGIILSGCGIGWILLSFIPIICKNPLSNWGVGANFGCHPYCFRDSSCFFHTNHLIDFRLSL